MEKAIDRIPDHLKPQNSGTGRLFKSRVMEALTRTHISIPVTIHLIIVAGVLYWAWGRFTPLALLTLFFAGWITWTFAEYIVHRFGYHFNTVNETWKKIQHMGHGIHHQYPRDPTRLAMPPLPAILLAGIFYGLFWLIMRQYAVAFFPGFLFGYVMYISLHYAQHRFAPPAFGPLNRLWKFHALHHYKYPETKAFGVSTRLWDWLFGTLPPKSI
jgi:sterol desaturase/sphingolipid hydroxylase (fatty acid hydroxylase superfamily)